MDRLAETEQAPALSELHLAEAIVKLGGDGVTRVGINGNLMINNLARLVGRVQPSPADAGKVWCLCDTTFFQESRAVFDQTDWARVIGVPAIVLVVPPVVVRELDEQKSDPRPHRSRHQDRARKVLGRLDGIIDVHVSGQPVKLRANVDIVMLDREPNGVPAGARSALAR
jgi:hypothetical protein